MLFFPFPSYREKGDIEFFGCLVQVRISVLQADHCCNWLPIELPLFDHYEGYRPPEHLYYAERLELLRRAVQEDWKSRHLGLPVDAVRRVNSFLGSPYLGPYPSPTLQLRKGDIRLLLLREDEPYSWMEIFARRLAPDSRLPSDLEGDVILTSQWQDENWGVGEWLSPEEKAQLGA